MERLDQRMAQDSSSLKSALAEHISLALKKSAKIAFLSETTHKSAAVLSKTPKDVVESLSLLAKTTLNALTLRPIVGGKVGE